jgi:hypothetical protein
MTLHEIKECKEDVDQRKMMQYCTIGCCKAGSSAACKDLHLTE